MATVPVSLLIREIEKNLEKNIHKLSFEQLVELSKINIDTADQVDRQVTKKLEKYTGIDLEVDNEDIETDLRKILDDGDINELGWYLDWYNHTDRTVVKTCNMIKDKGYKILDFDAVPTANSINPYDGLGILIYK